MKYCSICHEKFDDAVSFCPKDGEVLEEDVGSLVGTALDGQYQIESMLGKGGMGAVYRARHILLGDRVAIKVLPPEMRSNTEWLRRFQREGQAARRFRHPNAVTVYDLRTSADGTIYLVMEYVEGNTLDAELRKRGKFSAAEAVAVLGPIMGVLNAAHAMGVVHRDLKPENIMIGKATTGGAPVVKLLDLGIAKLREVAGTERTGNTNLTIAGQMLGTPYYMSPEQWGELPDDGNSEIDGRADIYSLGCVFYEIIAGKRPFSGMTLAELRRQHIAVTPLPLNEVDAGVPASFGGAIARAMSKDRAGRQPTAGELETELLNALSSEGISPVNSLPEVQVDSAAGVSRSTPTSPHQTAATLVTGINEAEALSAAPPTIASQASTMPTVIAQPKAAVEPPVGRPAQSIAAQPKVAARKTSPFVFLGAGLLVLLLIAGVGGYAVMHYMGSTPASTSATTKPPQTNEATDVAGGHEVGRYWLQVNSEGKSEDVRADDPLHMNSGQQFRLHFSPSESGYLYIIGPGENNAPTTFLTAKPPADSGIESNEVKSGQDFSFPANEKDYWLNLDKTAGTDEFTIIFSSNPLTTPDFLTSEAHHELTEAEQKELDDVIAPFKANLLGTEVIKTGASPFVSVKVPQSAAEGSPVVFKVKIEHK
jgi:serine/threonine-protein kinase